MKALLQKYKYYLLGILIFLPILGLGWWWWNRRPFDAWSIMPNNPVVIFETRNLLGAYQDVQNKPLWKNLQVTIYFSTIAAIYGTPTGKGKWLVTFFCRT
jgi:hypothetical protein